MTAVFMPHTAEGLWSKLGPGKKKKEKKNLSQFKLAFKYIQLIVLPGLTQGSSPCPVKLNMIPQIPQHCDQSVPSLSLSHKLSLSFSLSLSHTISLSPSLSLSPPSLTLSLLLSVYLSQLLSLL